MRSTRQKTGTDPDSRRRTIETSGLCRPSKRLRQRRRAAVRDDHITPAQFVRPARRQLNINLCRPPEAVLEACGCRVGSTGKTMIAGDVIDQPNHTACPALAPFNQLGASCALVPSVFARSGCPAAKNRRCTALPPAPWPFEWETRPTATANLEILQHTVDPQGYASAPATPSSSNWCS